MGPRLLSFLPLPRIASTTGRQARPLPFQNASDGGWSRPTAMARQRFTADASAACLTGENKPGWAWRKRRCMPKQANSGVNTTLAWVF